MYRAYGIDMNKIALQIDVAKVSLGIDIAIPCGLIIHELLSNALKYAFPKGKTGKVSIKIQTVGKNTIKISVSDNGIGIPKTIDFRKAESLGLHLVTILAEEQLQGNVRLDRRKGTKFHITFKSQNSR